MIRTVYVVKVKKAGWTRWRYLTANWFATQNAADAHRMSKRLAQEWADKAREYGQAKIIKAGGR